MASGGPARRCRTGLTGMRTPVFAMAPLLPYDRSPACAMARAPARRDNRQPTRAAPGPRPARDCQGEAAAAGSGKGTLTASAPASLRRAKTWHLAGTRDDGSPASGQERQGLVDRRSVSPETLAAQALGEIDPAVRRPDAGHQPVHELRAGGRTAPTIRTGSTRGPTTRPTSTPSGCWRPRRRRLQLHPVRLRDGRGHRRLPVPPSR